MRDAKKTQIRGHFEQYIYRIKKKWWLISIPIWKYKGQSTFSVHKWVSEQKSHRHLYIGSKGKLWTFVITINNRPIYFYSQMILIICFITITGWFYRKELFKVCKVTAIQLRSWTFVCVSKQQYLQNDGRLLWYIRSC